jgi:hypothetical protein
MYLLVMLLLLLPQGDLFHSQLWISASSRTDSPAATSLVVFKLQRPFTSVQMTAAEM